MKRIMIIVLAVLIVPFLAKAAKDLQNDPNNLADLNGCADYSKDNPVTKDFKYVLNGQEGTVSATLYPGLNQCLSNLKMESSLPNAKHAQQEDQDDADVVNNIPQNDALQELADNIQKVTDNKDDQARIAVSIVQGMKYEDKDKNTYDYPYQVAFEGKGICNETAKLGILLLRKLGFGTAMLTFEDDNHQAFGIKCDPQYSFQNSGYCFVEATTRAIISDPVGEKYPVRVNQIADGLTFDASKDHADTQSYLSLLKKGLDTQQKILLSELQNHYGLKK